MAAETIGSLHSTLDPKSLIPSHYSDASIDPFNSSKTLQLITDPYFMERGPRYDAYAQLRESKLRSKRLKFEEDEQVLDIPKSEFSPAKKTVRFQGTFEGNHSKKQGYSVLAQSVPDFSSVVRKENRKPPENRIPRPDKSATPPPSLSKREKMYGSGTKLGGLGSKSVNSGEKQSSGKLMMMGRKSYASIEELKGLSIAASNAINGDNRGTKRAGNVLRKSTVFSTRYY